MKPRLYFDTSFFSQPPDIRSPKEIVNNEDED